MKVMCTVIETVGDLKEVLNDVPDNYKISACGLSSCLALIDEDNESVLLDEAKYMNENAEILGGLTDEEQDFISNNA